MSAIQPSAPRTSTSRRPAHRYYCAGALVHAVVAIPAVWFGYRSYAGVALLIAFVLAVVALLTWRRKAVIETTESVRGADDVVLHTHPR